MRAYTVVLKRPDYIMEADTDLNPYYTAFIDAADGRDDALLQAQIEAFAFDEKEDLVPEDAAHRSIFYDLVIMLHGIAAVAWDKWETVR